VQQTLRVLAPALLIWAVDVTRWVAWLRSLAIGSSFENSLPLSSVSVLQSAYVWEMASEINESRLNA